MQELGCSSFSCAPECDGDATNLARCAENNQVTTENLAECSQCLVNAWPENSTDCNEIQPEHCGALQTNCSDLCGPCQFQVEQQSECEILDAGCTRFECGGVPPLTDPPTGSPTLSPTGLPTLRPTFIPTLQPTMINPCETEQANMNTCMLRDLVQSDSLECSACAQDAFNTGHQNCFDLGRENGGVCNRLERCDACGTCLDEVDEWAACESSRLYPFCDITCQSATAPPAPPPDKGLSTGVIAGIAVGGAGAILIGFGIFWLLRRHKHGDDDSAEERGMATGPQGTKDQPQTSESGNIPYVDNYSEPYASVDSAQGASNSSAADAAAAGVAAALVHNEDQDGEYFRREDQYNARDPRDVGAPHYKGQGDEDPAERTVRVQGQQYVGGQNNNDDASDGSIDI